MGSGSDGVWQGVGWPKSTSNVPINQISKYSLFTALQREGSRSWDVHHCTEEDEIDLICEKENYLIIYNFSKQSKSTWRCLVEVSNGYWEDGRLVDGWEILEFYLRGLRLLLFDRHVVMLFLIFFVGVNIEYAQSLHAWEVGYLLLGNYLGNYSDRRYCRQGRLIYLRMLPTSNQAVSICQIQAIRLTVQYIWKRKC